MVNRIKASDPHGLNKKCSSKFREGSRIRQEIPEECQRIYCSKHKNKDEDNGPKTLNDENH